MSIVSEECRMSNEHSHDSPHTHEHEHVGTTHSHATRTPQGITAATWLETHGKKDVWKAYEKQYAQFVPGHAGKQAKALFKKTYELANAVTAAGKTKFARPSPYITDPSLHALNQKKFSKKFSYPSKHALISTAMVVLLSHLEPHRASEYRWMANEIDYSRLYAGGHYPSDISASAYLGALVANYEIAHAQQ